MIAFSGEASEPENTGALSTAGLADSQLSSIVNSSPSHTITDRSITFCSSRTLPGHGYESRLSSVRLLTRRSVKRAAQLV